MTDSLILMVLTLFVFLFLAGPAALLWCFLLKQDNTRLRAELTRLDDFTRELSRSMGERAAPARASAEQEVAERREAVREVLRKIHTPEPAPTFVEPTAEPVSALPLAASPPPASPPPASPPPSLPSPPPPPPVAPDSSSERPGWEHWIGVRGAAALGAIVLVLAGLYFFRYSIEKGLITPAMRVALGSALGAACLIGSETVLRRRFTPLAHWIAGAGVAILYLSFWAAAARYALISVPLASALMILVTVTSCLLAVKRRSLAVALLGLVGGFATPILLSTGSDRPIALFSYLLVLDAALLFVAHARRWPALALFSLLGTALYQGLWIVDRMGPDRLGLGVGILLVFSLLFAFGTRRREAEDDSVWALTRVAAAVAPFLFALYFGLSAELSQSFLLPGAYLAVIVLGAAGYGARDRTSWLGLGAVAGGLGALVAWLATHAPTTASAWEVMGVSAVLAIALQALAERDRKAPGSAAPVWTLGVLIATAGWALAGPAIAVWPWLIGWTVLALVTLRHAQLPGREALNVVSPGLLAASLALLTVIHATSQRFTDPRTVLLSALALAVGAGLFAVSRPLGQARRYAGHGAALFAAVLLSGYALVPVDLALSRLELFAGTLLLGLLVCIAALGARSSLWFLVAVLLTALVQGRFTWELDTSSRFDLGVALLLQSLAVVAFTGWALVVPKHARNDRFTWRAAALAGPVFFPATRHAFVGLYGDGAIALVPLALAVVSVAAAAAVRSRGPSEPDVRRTALVWLGAVAVGFVTAAIPLQLQNEWVTLAWALQGALTLAFWRRVDHVGLKYFALALLGAVAVRLVVNPAVLEYHVRGSLPVLNWLSYTYLVPAVCMGVAWWLSRDLEVARLRVTEQRWLPAQVQPLVARLSSLFAIAIVFVWLNLTIIDLFSSGPTLSVAIEHLPARDLTLSVAWAVYALGLLCLGVLRSNMGLRGLSLALLLVTCGKVFLYDLSHLADLYRVASLAGLAVSLIVVSLAYQRFVFRQGDWRMHAT